MNNKLPIQMDMDNHHKEDQQLILKILEGNQEALSELVEKHYSYIYNLALKFFDDIPDAEDASQEVIVKIITSISSYKPEKAQFRTWVYRIVLNHFLKTRKSGPEKVVVNGFETFFDIIDQIPDQPMTSEEERKNSGLIDEVKVACMSGMLMCLEREQRFIYIIGDLFEIDHKTGGEIFDISPENFRQRLSRARKDLTNWMNNKCGLVNRNNPCRCPKKTRGFVEKGFVDPENLKWHTDFSRRISEVSQNEVDNMLLETEKIYSEMYKDHPFKDTKEQSDRVLNTIRKNKDFTNTFGLEG